MINITITFVYGIFKFNELNIRNASQIFQREAGELISEVVLIFSEPSDIGSPLAFLVRNTVLAEYLSKDP